MMTGYIYVIRLKPFGRFLQHCYFDLDNNDDEFLYVVDSGSLLDAQRFTTEELAKSCCDVLSDFGHSSEYLRFKA